MKVTCPACNAQYTLADERLDGRRVKARCKRCGESFPIDPPQPRGEVYERQGARRRAPDADLFAGVATAGAEGVESLESVRSVADTSHPLLTGERNESSVLFSLAALARQAPAPVAPQSTESSALIDIRALVSAGAASSAVSPSHDEGSASRADDIMNLGGGGAFAPLFASPLAPPVTFAPANEDAARRNRGPLAIGAIGLAGVAMVGIAAFASVHSKAPAPPAREAAAVGAPAEVSNVVGSTSSNITAAAPSEETPAASASSASSAVLPARTGTTSNVAPPARSAATANDTRPVAMQSPTATAPSAPAKCCPGESEIACHMRVSAGAACSAEPPGSPGSAGAAAQPFDRPAAARALGINVASCKRGDGPTGPGHVKVTFQPNGSVSAVAVDAPYAGTATGSCVAQRYRGVSVPAFAGGPLSVGKTFAVE